MKNFYITLVIIFINSTLTAQIISFTDAVFKAKLLQSDTDSPIARNQFDNSIAIDVNKNGEIEIAEAMQVSHLDIEGSSVSSMGGIANFTNLISIKCGSNLMSSLNVENLTKLTDLNCNNNILNSLTLTGAINLQNLNCQSNRLTTLNLSNLSNLVTVDCSNNQLTSVNLAGLTNLTSFICASNSIASINLNDLTSLLSLECNRNMLTSLDLSKLTELTSLNCNFNLLSSLDVRSLLELNDLDCSNNRLLSLKVDGLVRLSSLNCNKNLLTAININTLFNITFLNCNNNNLQTIQVTGLGKLKVLDVSRNQISTLDIYGLTTLQFLYCNNNKIVNLDASSQIGLQLLFIHNNLLKDLYIKNGSSENSLVLSGNPNLSYICADDSEIAFVQEEITNSGYTNCFVNSYCSFVPVGNYYSFVGQNKLDSDKNGCNASDENFPNLKLAITDAATTTTFITNSTGNFAYEVLEGTFVITPKFENPSYYTISPKSITANFPADASPFPTSFCITPNTGNNDLEIVLLPLDNARPNFESTYKIVFKNKGTATQSGVASLRFDDTALTLVNSNPNISSQVTNNLNWNFTNLLPQETRSITVTLKVNPVSMVGSLLNLSTTITNTADKTPIDNNADLNQIVANSTNLNDKICLQGNAISQTKVGDYVHYIIRFKNTGSEPSSYIVVKDLIDTSKFDISTLIPISASHSFITKITNDTTAEFIFENINLPFDEGNNDGYLAFKIKTLGTLKNGDELTNSAILYFGYQQQLNTNIAKTKIQTLKTKDFVYTNAFAIYPNPVKNNLNIDCKEEIENSSITIYNALGQAIQTHINGKFTTTSIDVSDLKSGIYFIKINSDKGNSTAKFIKE